MAVDLQPDNAQQPGSHAPGGRAAEPGAVRAWWRRPAIHTALIGAVLGYFLGHWLGNFIASGYQQVQNASQNDFAIVLGDGFGTLGWLGGVGVFGEPGRPGSSATRWTTRSSASSTWSE